MSDLTTAEASIGRPADNMAVLKVALFIAKVIRSLPANEIKHSLAIKVLDTCERKGQELGQTSVS